MALFPTSSSILSAIHLAGWLKETYPFNQSIQCTLIRAGINHHYLIETLSEKYILRIYFYQWRSLEQIEEELNFIIQLKALNQAVAYPIENRNKNYINTLEAPEGPRIAVLFSFARGDYLPNPSAEVCYQIGKRIAEFHQLTQDQFFLYRKNYNTNTLSKWALEQINQRFSPELPAIQYLQKCHQAIETAFEETDMNLLPQGKIHLDIWYDNVRIDNGQKITLYDFDNCGNGWFFLDLAYTCMTIHNTEPDQDKVQKKLDQFFAGYQSIRPLQTLELQLIPYGGLAIWIHYLGVQCFRFEDWSNLFLNEGFVKHWAQRAKKWLAFNQISIQQ